MRTIERDELFHTINEPAREKTRRPSSILLIQKEDHLVHLELIRNLIRGKCTIFCDPKVERPRDFLKILKAINDNSSPLIILNNEISLALVTLIRSVTHYQKIPVSPLFCLDRDYVRIPDHLSIVVTVTRTTLEKYQQASRLYEIFEVIEYVSGETL